MSKKDNKIKPPPKPKISPPRIIREDGPGCFPIAIVVWGLIAFIMFLFIWNS